MVTEEAKTKNVITFQKQLEKYGVDVQKLIDTHGDKIKEAPYFTTKDSGLAFNGSLVNFLLKTLTPYAIKINELLPDELKVSRDSLIKVCFLHQISKSIMFIQNDNAWEVEKRGMLYKFSEYNYALKTGIRSLILCQENGISFTEEEIEAMTIMDRDATDEQARFFASPMSVIIRQANELSLLENKLIKQ